MRRFLPISFVIVCVLGMILVACGPQGPEPSQKATIESAIATGVAGTIAARDATQTAAAPTGTPTLAPITAQPPAPTATTPPTDTPTPVLLTYYVNVDGANVRSGPGKEYKIVRQLVYGDKVQVYPDSLEQEWYRIVGNGKDQYIHSSLLSKTVPPTLTPAPSKPPSPTPTLESPTPTPVATGSPPAGETVTSPSGGEAPTPTLTVTPIGSPPGP
jgi:hypothetical protein